MTMVITNLTSQDYWFGPLHLPAGTGQTLQVDDQSATSLYLTDDSVADAINTLYAASPPKITVVPSTGTVFPRATGAPEVLHGDGSPEGMVYAGQGSLYLRRDNTGGAQLYQKTTGIHVNTGWIAMAGAVVTTPTGAVYMYGGVTPPSGWLICDGSAVARTTYADLFGVIGTLYGSGDGSSTFNLPDLRGRVPVGYAASGGHPDVSTIGGNEGQATAYRRPKHRTTNSLSVQPTGETRITSGGTFGHVIGMGRTDGTDQDTVNFTLSGSIGTNNGNDAVDTPSYIVLNYIMKT